MATGYNGLKSGMTIEPWMLEDKNRARKSKLFIHAETNAMNLMTEAPSIIAVTWSPCESCAKRIASLPTELKVVFINDYLKDQEYRDIFNFYKVPYSKLSDESMNRIKDRFNQSFERVKQLRWP